MTMTETDRVRHEQLKATAMSYLQALEQKDFDLIPYAEQAQLRAHWWAPLPALLGDVELVDLYFNDDLTAVVTEARIQILVAPPVWLRVADRFRVDHDGRIV